MIIQKKKKGNQFLKRKKETILSIIVEKGERLLLTVYNCKTEPTTQKMLRAKCASMIYSGGKLQYMNLNPMDAVKA
jgi:hypothetical protein